MKTKRVSGRQDLYLKLIHQFPLRPIRLDKELDEATLVLDSLTGRLDTLAAEERDYLAILPDIVERYEDQTIPVEAVSDRDVLRHLIEAKGVTQSQVGEGAGIAVSTISEVLTGRRKLSRTHIGRLSKFFGVGPGVFSFE